jgi:hypothetical protein
MSELAAAEAAVRTDIATLLNAAKGHSGFDAAVASAAGFAPADQARVPLIRERIEIMCGHA